MTTEVDTFSAYIDHILSESPLAALCREVVEGELMPMTDAIHVGLEEGLALVASPILWVWASIHLDALRNRKETQEVQLRLDMILKLQEDGYSRVNAERLVEKMLNAVGRRNKDDPSIKSLLQIVSTVKGLKPPLHPAELIEPKIIHDDPDF